MAKMCPSSENTYHFQPLATNTHSSKVYNITCISPNMPCISMGTTSWHIVNGDVITLFSLHRRDKVLMATTIVQNQ